MKRFLRREWDATVISEEIYGSARNRAFQRLRNGRRGNSSIAWRWVAAVSSVWLVGSVSWLWLLDRAPQPVSLLAGDLEPVELMPSRPPFPIAAAVKGPVRPVDGAGRTVSSSSPPALALTETDLPERIVMNFVLPDSGVRMIWIKDRNFDLSGGLK